MPIHGSFRFRVSCALSLSLHFHGLLLCNTVRYRSMAEKMVHGMHPTWPASILRRDHISFAEFDSSVQGWINHVRYADSWGLRSHVLAKPLIFNRSAHK